MPFKSSYSFGCDEVPTKLLKLCSHIIRSPLNYICNRTLFTGVFPDRLKYAIIRILFKKCNNNYLTNYRPISILTSFSKMFEKVMHTIMLKYLTDHNILSKERYGFGTKLKTDNAKMNNNLLIRVIFCI
jgi:Notch-like protein